MRFCLVVFVVLEIVGPLEQVLALVAYAAHGVLGGFLGGGAGGCFIVVYSVKTC